MLSELALEVHNIECLLKKSRTLGVISCLVDVHKNPKNSVLIGRVEKIYSLIKKSNIWKRDQLRFVLKEVYADGNYGHYFLAVFFNEIAIEIDSAKLNIGDRLVFKEPRVFAYATYRPKNILHNLYVQIGLGDKSSPTLWFARKYQQDMSQRKGKQVKSSKNGTSESMVTSPATGVSTNEIEIIDDELSRDDADKIVSDCFVLLEGTMACPCKRKSSDNENNNVKDNTQLKIGTEIQSKYSSVSEQNKITQINKVTVDKQHFNTMSKESAVVMSKNIQENITDTHDKQKKKCNAAKKSTQKSVKSSSSTDKEAKTMNISPHTSPEKMSCTSSGSGRTEENNNNTKQQTVTLADDIKILQVVTCSTIQEDTPNGKIINNEIRKLGLPGTSKCGIDEISNEDTQVMSPEIYDEKLFMSPVIVLNDFTQNKYKIFVNNNKETYNVNSENKLFRSPPKLKKLSAENDDSDDCRAKNEDRSPPKLNYSSLLCPETIDIDQSNLSESTVELDELLISKKKEFVKKTRSLCRTNKNKQIKKSLSSNESVPTTVNRKTTDNDMLNMEIEKRITTKKRKQNENEENDNKVEQNEPVWKPPLPSSSSSSSSLKSSDPTLVPHKRKLSSSEKTEYLLSDKGQEQHSSVLSLFDEIKDSEQDILLEHSNNTLNKDSSVQDYVSCVSKSCTNNNDNNNFISTALIHDNEFTKPELANMSNKQTCTNNNLITTTAVIHNNEFTKPELAVMTSKQNYSSLLCPETIDIDQSNLSESTVELEELMISKKRGFVKKTRSLCRQNKNKQIKKSLSSNESVPTTVNRKITDNDMLNMESEKRITTKKRKRNENEENDNKDEQNEPRLKPPPPSSSSSSSSSLKSSDPTLVPHKRKLFSSEKTEHLLSNKGQEQHSSVLSLFDEIKDSKKDILLEHSNNTLNEESSVQDYVSCVSKSCTNNNDNNFISTALIHDKPEVANMSNKQTDTITEQCSLKNNNNSNVSDIRAEVICNSSSSKVANLKQKYCKTAAGTTRPSKPRHELIKSYDEAVTAACHKHNMCLDSDDMYTAIKKRKSNTFANNNNSIAKVEKMVRFDYALPERKKRSISKTRVQMETEDDKCNRNEAVRKTSVTVDSIVVHQNLDEDCELSVITGFLVDIHPQPLGTIDLIIGHCRKNCGVHRYSNLIWFKNEEIDEPRCPACFKQGATRKVRLMFMFNISVMVTDGSIHNILVFDQAAEHFLDCTVQEYITNKAKRLTIRDMFQSKMISATSGRKNAPKIQFCVCDRRGIKVLIKNISTNPINSNV